MLILDPPAAPSAEGSGICVQKITAGALGFELGAVAVLGGTVLAYDYFSSKDSSYGYY